MDQENCKELVFEKMEALRKAASAHADTYREKAQDQANKGRKPHEFKEGEQVYKIIPTGGLKRAKLAARYEGPFGITKSFGPGGECPCS